MFEQRAKWKTLNPAQVRTLLETGEWVTASTHSMPSALDECLLSTFFILQHVCCLHVQWMHVPCTFHQWSARRNSSPAFPLALSIATTAQVAFSEAFVLSEETKQKRRHALRFEMEPAVCQTVSLCNPCSDTIMLIRLESQGLALVPSFPRWWWALYAASHQVA